MGSATGLVLLFTLLISYNIADAKSSINLNLLGNSVPTESRMPLASAGNEQLCQLCEEYSAEALSYLKNNDTQTEILSILQQACSKLYSFSGQCINLVDNYIPLLFLEVAAIEPQQLCEKFHLCSKTMFIRLPTQDSACSLCHHVVIDILNKLKDPESELEIIDVLLKGCSQVENFVQQCKQIIIEYAPLIVDNVQKFLEANDVCSSIHACKASTEAAGKEAAVLSAA